MRRRITTMRLMKALTVTACLAGLVVSLSGCGGSASNGQPEPRAPLGPQSSRPPQVVPKAVKPRLLKDRLPDTWHQPGLRCTFRLFSEGSGAATTVKTCFLTER
jgi:hypothetical protein